MRFMIVTLLVALFLSCGDDDAPVPPSSPPTWTAAERMAVATSIPLTRESIALTREPIYTSEHCEEARERLAGSDFVKVEPEEQGRPTWEERFLDVDIVVRAKLVSSRPRIASIREGRYSGRHYPAIQMTFRVFEVFHGSIPVDYVFAWQIGWDYYGSYPDAECVRPESIASLRQDYLYLDDREAVLFLKGIGNVEGFENIEAGSDKISRNITQNFISRLPSEMKSPSLLEDEQWRWLPHHEGNIFYDRKYPADSLHSVPKGTVTTQELREIGDKLEELEYTHDPDCVYEAYRRARNFNKILEELMKDCARE